MVKVWGCCPWADWDRVVVGDVKNSFCSNDLLVRLLSISAYHIWSKRFIASDRDKLDFNSDFTVLWISFPWLDFFLIVSKLIKANGLLNNFDKLEIFEILAASSSSRIDHVTPFVCSFVILFFLAVFLTSQLLQFTVVGEFRVCLLMLATWHLKFSIEVASWDLKLKI